MRTTARTLVGLTAVGLCVALVGCNRKPAPPAPGGGSTSSKAEKARKDAEQLALGGVTGGATAHAKADPTSSVRHDTGAKVVIDSGRPGTAMKGTAAIAKASAPTTAPRPGWIVRERVKSTIPYATEAEAEEDALTLAREVVERKLAALDPPVRYKPSLGAVKNEFVRKDSRAVRQPDAAERDAFAQYGVTGNLVYIEYDVEITADQVRELRAQERVSAGLRVTGLLFAVALAGFLFLRADEWTKGYLTSWLALGAVALAGGAAAAFILV